MSKGRRVPAPAPSATTAEDSDRLYFEQHPETTEYIRPYISGEYPVEFFAPDGHAVLIRVTQIAPGIRSRKAFLSKIGLAA